MRIGIGNRLPLPFFSRGNLPFRPQGLNAKIHQLAVGKLQMPEFIKKTADFLGKKNITYDSLNYAFYALRIPFLYLEYFILKIKNDTIPSIIGSVLSFFSDLGSMFQWFSKLKIIDFAKVGEVLGKIRCLSFLTKIPLIGAINVLFGLANLFYGIDAVIKLSKGNLEKKEKISAWCDLAASVMHVALMILFLAGCASMPFFTVLSLIGAAVAIGAFCVRMYVNCSPSPKPVPAV